MMSIELFTQVINTLGYLLIGTVIVVFCVRRMKKAK